MEDLSQRPLFIFEMANNHMGSVEHGLRIIREIHAAAEPFQSQFRLAFKLQYRQLDTFLHPAYRDRDDIKYVKRFRETRLNDAEFRQLKAEMDRLGFLTICTPFDEESVDRIEEHGFGVLKIASCSFTDWPLLERIVRSAKPVIASTAGVPLDDIDKVVSFFQHRRKDFSLMHCVAQYPTPAEGLELNQVDLLRSRYPGVPVGFSTHEAPQETGAVQMAIAKGARMFEKHVGVATEGAPLNAYSASPEQVSHWLQAAARAFRMCGVEGQRAQFSEAEISSLHALRRGVFAAEAIPEGDKLHDGDPRVFFAIPTQPGQLTANDLSKYVTLQPEKPIAKDGPVLSSGVRQVDHREKIHAIVRRVNGMIQQAGVVVPGQAEFEISHHYGVERFEEVGATIINLVNREYCKKLIVVLAGQRHPEHAHKLKEETFLVLHGDITIDLEGATREYGPGDLLVVERGMRHSFRSKRGVIMEEISSTHYKGDSYYTDPLIAPVNERKTSIAYWLGSAAVAPKRLADAAD
jgi:sialic acid synthase SpsE/quercetin dioxygenase-like cupin family protein